MTILWDFDPGALEHLPLRPRRRRPAAQLGPARQPGPRGGPGPPLVVIGPDIDLDSACELAESERVDRPELGVILLRHRLDVTVLAQALRSGVREVVQADDQHALADAVRRSASR